MLSILVCYITICIGVHPVFPFSVNEAAATSFAISDAKNILLIQIQQKLFEQEDRERWNAYQNQICFLSHTIPRDL